ncbi:MAG: SDR family oxidoreductase [Chloroflexi bacterium]|nr:SDR family oxidoreductase [Chloroflexota bacterium]
MSSAQKRTALITGASGGIGLEFGKIFAREGYNLVLVARSGGKLHEIAAELTKQYGAQVTVLAQDLGQPNAAQAVYDALQAQNINVDVLINNAGFANYGYFTEIETQKDLDLIQLNIAVLTHLCKLFLPGMKAHGWGRVLNVASTAAFFPGPLMAVYYASKAYVLSLSEALAREMRGTGVIVTALCPGPTESGFQQRAAMEDSKLVQGGLMSAAQVAEEGYRALMGGTTVVVTGIMNKIIAFSHRLMPRNMAADVVMNQQQRVGH